VPSGVPAPLAGPWKPPAPGFGLDDRSAGKLGASRSATKARGQIDIAAGGEAVAMVDGALGPRRLRERRR